MEIYLMRHGTTDWNLAKKIQGSTDIPLNEDGILLAQKSGENLKNTHFDAIFSSPLIRAYRTALCIRGDRADIPLIKDERLREFNFGIYEGKTSEERDAMSNGRFSDFFKAPEKFVPKEGGESLPELLDRTRDFMKNMIEPLALLSPDENPFGKNKNIERIFISGHGAMNKAIMMYVKGRTDLSLFWDGPWQRNCNVVIMKYENEKYEIVNEEAFFGE